ncbi:MAG: aspartate carbamoyltransferase, partial [Gammaproteobacteria bacterium]
EETGIAIQTTNSLNDCLPKLDVVYINAIAWVGEEAESFGTKFELNSSSHLKKEAIILHPLARGNELSTDLDQTSHNWYFSQARGAVFIRMALLTCMSERTERVIDVI